MTNYDQLLHSFQQQTSVLEDADQGSDNTTATAAADDAIEGAAGLAAESGGTGAAQASSLPTQMNHRHSAWHESCATFHKFVREVWIVGCQSNEQRWKATGLALQFLYRLTLHLPIARFVTA